MIYHIVKNTDWILAKQNGLYSPISLSKEGFIHTSKINQVQGVLNRYYKGEKNLMLLHIEEQKLQSPFIFEFSATLNEEFPHIYGPLNIDAVVKEEPL